MTAKKKYATTTFGSPVEVSLVKGDMICFHNLPSEEIPFRYLGNGNFEIALTKKEVNVLARRELVWMVERGLRGPTLPGSTTSSHGKQHLEYEPLEEEPSISKDGRTVVCYISDDEEHEE